MEDVQLSIWEHLDELRKRLVWALGGWLAATAVAWTYAPDILRYLVRPPVERLVFNSPTEPFLAHVKVALVAGFVAAFPWIGWQAWLFVSPGLKENERRWAGLVLLPSYLLFLAGCALGFFGAGPIGLKFLLSFSSELLQPYIGLDNYLRYMTYLSLGTGVLFQLPVVLFLLSKMGIVSASSLGSYRRHVFVGLLVAAALLTPGPDVVGQLLVCLPAYALYELSILVVRLTSRRA